ncbi:MAG: hypothetical protein ACC662_10845 [Planctomycetota bacterium]
MRDPVLLPPDEGTRAPLPAWTVVAALIGLVLLGASTIPAIYRGHRLERGHTRLRCETLRQEERLRQLQRALRAARKDSFVREQALRTLLLPPDASARPAGPGNHRAGSRP